MKKWVDAVGEGLCNAETHISLYNGLILMIIIIIILLFLINLALF